MFYASQIKKKDLMPRSNHLPEVGTLTFRGGGSLGGAGTSASSDRNE